MTKKQIVEYAKEGILKGVFWSIGVSIGFAIVSVLLAFLAANIITLPVIGNAIADIVRVTLESL